METKSNGPFCKHSDVETLCSTSLSYLICWTWAALQGSWIQALVSKPAEPGPGLALSFLLDSFKEDAESSGYGQGSREAAVESPASSGVSSCPPMLGTQVGDEYELPVTSTLWIYNSTADSVLISCDQWKSKAGTVQSKKHN